jgi:hypothetical protein
MVTFAVLILLRRRITSGRPEQLRAITNARFYGTGKRWTHRSAPIFTGSALRSSCGICWL